MTMGVAVWIAGTEYADWAIRRAVSQWFGLGMILLAWLVDVWKARHGNFAFWLHLFGILTFWGAVTASHSASEIAKAVYGAMNVGLILLSVFLGRRVYAVFGALGLALYLGHLAEKVFKDSLLFPFALSLIGIAIIAAGLVYNRRRDTIAAWLDARLPRSVQRLIPSPGDQNLWAQSRSPMDQSRSLMDMMSQGRSVSLFHASQQWSRMSPEEAKIRFEIQLSRMYCQMFSTGFNSGALAGSGTSVMLSGTTRRLD